MTKLNSSSAEYLTYIAANDEDFSGLEVKYEDENIWLIQKEIAKLYGDQYQLLMSILKMYIKTMK